MNKLSEIAKTIIDNRLPGSNEALFNHSLEEFMKSIDSYNDFEDLIEIIRYDKKYYLLPFEVCNAIFNRLLELGKKNSFLLIWYSGILRMYGDPKDYELADRLEEEGNETEGKFER